MAKTESQGGAPVAGVKHRADNAEGVNTQGTEGEESFSYNVVNASTGRPVPDSVVDELAKVIKDIEKSDPDIESTNTVSAQLVDGILS